MVGIDEAIIMAGPNLSASARMTMHHVCQLSLLLPARKGTVTAGRNEAGLLLVADQRSSVCIRQPVRSIALQLQQADLARQTTVATGGSRCPRLVARSSRHPQYKDNAGKPWV